MSFPSPIDSPSEYLDHITSLGLDCTINTFQHFQTRLVQPLGSRYDESLALEWCERMDLLLVHQFFFSFHFLLSDTNCFQGKLGHMIGSHKHSELVTGPSQLCAGSVAECESSLAHQKAEDSAEVKHLEEKQKIEMEKHALEQEVEKQGKMKEMEQKRVEIIQAERLLAAQRLSLLKAERGMDGMGDSDLDNDVGSQSTLCEQKVYMEFLCRLVLICVFIRERPRKNPSISLMRRHTPSCSK